MHDYPHGQLLRTFLVAAESGSLTRAGRILRRSPSTVGLQVARLEATVGEPLFRRSWRGVALTPAGEILLPGARRVVRVLDGSDAALQGAVRIGIEEEVGIDLLAEVLARFADDHPRVRLTVRCAPGERFLAALDRGELDLAVLSAEPGDEQGRLLMHEPVVWAAPARAPVHLEDPLPLALPERSCWWRDLVLDSLEQTGRRHRLAISSAGIGGVQAAVRAGLAVAALGRSMVPEGVRVLGERDGLPGLPVSAIVLRCRSGALPPAAERLRAVIAQAFDASPLGA